ncbi:hypothetical protein PLCT2_01772 [Planctomycetaceae bacterium]|nr:hypothetical protein PLCT2_01772 [Planctomycetaceae bacterium]
MSEQRNKSPERQRRAKCPEPARHRLGVVNALFGVLRVSSRALALAALVFCAPVHAEIDKNNLPPPPVTAEQRDVLLKEFKAEEAPKQRAELRAELEKEYRVKLEARLADERKQYEASLNNLWMSNAVVWGVLLLFIIWQGLGAKKQASELAKLKAARESKAS